MAHHIENSKYSIHNKYSAQDHLSELGKIFDHSDYGEGFEGMARHISQMSPTERMDFEDLELCGSKVLAPHDNIVVMPYYLTLEYLNKKLGEDMLLLEEYRDKVEEIRGCIQALEDPILPRTVETPINPAAILAELEEIESERDPEVRQL